MMTEKMEHEERLEQELSEEELLAAPSAPAEKWRRVLAWVLIGVMLCAIACWLLNIAFPNWIEALRGWLSAL